MSHSGGRLIAFRKTKRASKITVVQFAGEREQGKVFSVKENYGFIKCCDHPTSLYFHFGDVVILQVAFSVI